MKYPITDCYGIGEKVVLVWSEVRRWGLTACPVSGQTRNNGNSCIVTLSDCAKIGSVQRRSPVMTDRMIEAAKSPVFSKAMRRAVRELAKLDPQNANFEARYLALLFTERREEA